MADYLPRRDAELTPWSANFAAQIADNAVAWGIPTDEILDLQAATTSFATLQAQADSPAKTSIIVAEKNAARKTLAAKIRGMVDFRLKNPVITDAQRVALGLNIRDTTHTKIPVPSSRPTLNISVDDFRRLKIAFHDKGSASKAKPYGINGAVIAYAVLNTPPASIADLNRSVLATRTPHIIEFAETERGKTAYIAICWQNEKGEKGPWSEIENVIVP